MIWYLWLFLMMSCGIVFSLQCNRQFKKMLCSKISPIFCLWHGIANVQRLKFKMYIDWMSEKKEMWERKFNWIRLWCQSKVVFCCYCLGDNISFLFFFFTIISKYFFYQSNKNIQLHTNRLKMLFFPLLWQTIEISVFKLFKIHVIKLHMGIV